jgi:serine/threonine protein phosphatase PrpC
MDGLISIGEFSVRSGLSPKRLRSYAAAGLLVPAAVDSASGYRFYAPAQLRVAELIDALRRAGMPVLEIGAVLARPSVARLDAWSAQLQQDAVQRRGALDAARRLLAPEMPSPGGEAGQDTEATEAVMALQAVSRSEQGPVRERNEDAVVTGPRLVAVADGMGGAPGGEVASSLTIAIVADAFTGQSVDELAAGVRAANRAVWEHAAATGASGMGTTVCAAGLLDGGRLVVVHVGDSRAYLVRRGELTRITDDHSITGELVRTGELSEEEAARHPHRNVLTRALGVGPGVDLDSAVHPVEPDDRLLLCTDGLFTEVAAEDIAAVLGSRRDLQATADELIRLALAGGGRDNVSVVVAQVVA